MLKNKKIIKNNLFKKLLTIFKKMFFILILFVYLIIGFMDSINVLI